jgi:hypothetical protein
MTPEQAAAAVRRALRASLAACEAAAGEDDTPRPRRRPTALRADAPRPRRSFTTGGYEHKMLVRVEGQ